MLKPSKEEDKEEEKKEEVEKVESKSDSAIASKAETNRYYLHLTKIVKYSMEVESSLKTRGTTKIAIKNSMTLKEAKLVADVFYKAYEGDIKPLKITTETCNALKQAKLLNGVDISQLYPELCNKNETGSVSDII
jgi:hypothetical protein